MLYIHKLRMLVKRECTCMYMGTCSFRCFPLEAFSCSGAGAVYLVPIKEAEEMRYIRKEWLAGKMAQQNSSFLSGAVIKPASKNNLGEERIHITQTPRSQSITEASQGRNSSRSLTQKPWRTHLSGSFPKLILS